MGTDAKTITLNSLSHNGKSLINRGGKIQRLVVVVQRHPVAVIIVDLVASNVFELVFNAIPL